MVSLTAEYALRAVLFLAIEHGRPRTVQQIARMTRVPADYLSKVLQELSRSGLVRSQRGLYGGFRLLPDPSRVTVYDVVQAVSPLQRFSDAGPDHASTTDDVPAAENGLSEEQLLAPLQHLLDEVYEDVEHRFTDTRIADLIPTPAPTTPDVPAVAAVAAHPTGNGNGHIPH